ncbi:hypothetical protein C0J52_12614 [Blattella germanica]|nr:hypothetical protein C0J52_12614 [Blattella germanica]
MYEFNYCMRWQCDSLISEYSVKIKELEIINLKQDCSLFVPKKGKVRKLNNCTFQTKESSFGNCGIRAEYAASLDMCLEKTPRWQNDF